MHEITPWRLRECTQVDACPKISCIVCSSHRTLASVRMLSRTSEGQMKDIIVLYCRG
jgi:hypothetical protein